MCMCCGDETKRKWKNNPVCKKCQDAAVSDNFPGGDKRYKLKCLRRNNIQEFIKQQKAKNEQHRQTSRNN